MPDPVQKAAAGPDAVQRIKELARQVRSKHVLWAIEHDVDMYVTYAIADALEDHWYEDAVLGQALEAATNRGDDEQIALVKRMLRERCNGRLRKFFGVPSSS